MLPGFRFLFAAIFLSMSVLVFGLGAAALLRAAHEEFASNSSWHGRPESTFAQQSDATKPLLAMLRLDPPVAEKPVIETPAVEKPAVEKFSDDVPPTAAAEPAQPATSVEQAPATSPLAEPEKMAAVKPEASSLPDVPISDIPAAQRPPQPESPPQSKAVQPPPDVPAPVDEPRTTAGDAVAAAEAPPLAPGPTNAATATSPDAAATKIATLGGPPVTIEVLVKPAGAKPAAVKAAANPPIAKPAIAKPAAARPDPIVIQKRLQARRAAQQRRVAAARARLARQALQQQQAANPFLPPVIQPATR